MLAKYFSFKGRLNRKPFWIMHLILYVVLLAFFGLAFLIMGGTSAISNSNFSGGSFIILTIISVILLIVFYVSTFSITVRRMHDRNYSGWWLLAFVAISAVIGGLSEMFKGSEMIAGIIGLISIVLFIWYMVEVGFRKGTQGPNQYGPDPISGAVANPEVFGSKDGA